MQTCPECGTRNAAGAQFCSNCGTFLAWEDDRSPARTGSPAPPPQRPPDPPPQAARPPREDSTPRPATPRVVRTSTRVTPMPSSSPPASPAAPSPPATPPPASTPPAASQPLRPPDGTERVTSSRVRGPGSLPPSREPEAVPPGDTPAAPPRPRDQEADTPAPGEIVCSRCGAGNSPDRHFCRRCAMELRRSAPRPAPPPPPPPARRSPVVWVLAVLAALVVLWLLISLQ